MKLTIEKTKLLNSLSTVSKAVPSKTTNPILNCILFDATEGDIKLTGNDTELGIETIIKGEIREKGKVALDARIMFEIIRKTEGETVSIETDEKSDNLSTVIKCDKSVFNISGRNGEEFSNLPAVEKDKYISISQFTLKEVIRQTIISVAVGEGNKMMTGVNIEVKKDNVRFVTLDGHRISVRNIKLKESYAEASAIVPARALSEISKIISEDNDKEILIYFMENQILFEFEGTIVLSRLIDGRYFEIDNMISKDYGTKVVINKQKFLSEIERSMIMIRENEHKPLIFKISDDNISLSVKSTFGSMEGDVSCEKKGDDLKIAFNPKFFVDALRVIDSEEVNLFLTGQKNPCFIRDENDSYIYLILPVNFIEEN